MALQKCHCIFPCELFKCKLMTCPSYYEDLEDLRVEAIITEAKPRLLWLQLEGLLNLNNNEGRSLTGLENDISNMHNGLL